MCVSLVTNRAKRMWIWRSKCTENCRWVNTESDEFVSIWGKKKENIQPRGNCFNWSELDEKVRFWFEYPCSNKMGFVCQFKPAYPYVPHRNFIYGWFGNLFRKGPIYAVHNAHPIGK